MAPPYSPPDAGNIQVVVKQGIYTQPPSADNIEIIIGLDDLPVNIIVLSSAVTVTSTTIGSLKSATLSVASSAVNATSNTIPIHRSDMAIDDFYFSLDRSSPSVIFNDENLRSFYFASPGGNHDKPVIGASVRAKGKLYFEVHPGSDYLRTRVGLCNGSMGRSEGAGETANSWVVDAYTQKAMHNSSDGGTPLSDPLATTVAMLEKAGTPVFRERQTSKRTTFGIDHGTDVLCVAVDLDARKMWVGVNGIWSGDPARGTGACFSAAWSVATSMRIVVSNYEAKGQQSSLLCLLPGEFRWQPPLGFKPWGDPNRFTVEAVIDPSVVPTPLTNFPLKMVIDSTTGATGRDETKNHRILAMLAAAASRNHTPGFVAFGECIAATGPYATTATQGTLVEGKSPPHIARTLPFFATGRYYFEVRWDLVGNPKFFSFGLCADTINPEESMPSSLGPSCVYFPWQSGIQRRSNIANDPVCVNPSLSYSYGSPITINQGDIFGFVVDMDAREMYSSYNGVWSASSNPDTRTNPIFAGFPEDIAYAFYIQFNSNTNPQQRVTLLTREEDFTYSIPSGCKTLSGRQVARKRLNAYGSNSTPLDVEIANWSLSLVNPVNGSTVFSASSQYAAFTVPSYAFDGVMGTYWKPQDFSFFEWIRMDFGSGTTHTPLLVSVRLTVSQWWPQGHILSNGIICALKGSNDLQVWTTLGTKEIQQLTIEFDTRETDYDFTPFRYLRIEFTRQSTSHSIEIAEINVLAMPSNPSAEVWVKVPSVSDTVETSILVDFDTNNYDNSLLVAPGAVSGLPNNNHNINTNQLFMLRSTDTLGLTTDEVVVFSTDIDLIQVRTVLSIDPSVVIVTSTTFQQALGAFVIVRNSVVAPTSTVLALVQISLADQLTIPKGHVVVTSTNIGALEQTETPSVNGTLEIAGIDMEAEFGTYSDIEIAAIDMDADVVYSRIITADIELADFDIDSAAEIGSLISASIEMINLDIEGQVDILTAIHGDLELAVIDIESGIQYASGITADIGIIGLSMAASVAAGGEAEEHIMAFIDGGPDWAPFA